MRSKLVKLTNRYIITGAQNGTPVHKGFWAALQLASKKLNAQIIVIPLRYRNPTSFWSASADGEQVWCDEVLPYLFNGRVHLNANLQVLADVKTVPTASSPLTGMESLTGRESCIVGHTRLQFCTVAVPANALPKILTTTGACTVPNYTDSKAGKLGDFHHSLSAILVETEGKFFALRQLMATKDGSFIDLDREYRPSGICVAAPRAAALSLGDVHVAQVDKDVLAATKQLMALVKPERVVYHDLFDGQSVNPHERGNPFLAAAKQAADEHVVRKEVESAVRFVDDFTPSNTDAVVVSSNHDDFLYRWLVGTDWRQLAHKDNAEFYLSSALATLQTGRAPLAEWANRLGSSARWLATDESYIVDGVELSLHGDRGPNGARGSAKNLSKLGTKVTIGHSHSPRIEGGCWQTGTSSKLRMGYNTGPSSWLQSHVLQYANGKRCIINIIDGRWRL
jgi:hypothetical protein